MILVKLDKKPIKLYNKVKLQFEIFNKDFRQKISKLMIWCISRRYKNEWNDKYI